MVYLKNYLSISKKTWNGLVVLFIIIALYMVLSKIAGNTQHVYINERLIVHLMNEMHIRESSSKVNTKLSKFNPNTLSYVGWRNLGLTDRQVTVIMHYKEKGGRFYTKADVAKLYSISPEKFKHIEPLIDLPGGIITNPRKEKLTIPVELNSADSAALTTVYGIGPAFASRIIRYRNLLGGYNKKQQLMEVYGLDAKKYAEISSQMRVNDNVVKKINVNIAEANELNRLPYLTYKQANAIVQYRLQHGEYKSVDDLADIAILDARTIQNIKPYLIYK